MSRSTVARKRKKTADPAARAAELAEKRAAKAAQRLAEQQGPDLKVAPAVVRRFEKARRVVVTAAMNDAPLATWFWAALQLYCKERDAELLVIPLRYRNPTSPSETEVRAKEWTWTPEVQPHLVGSRLQLHKYLYVMADVRIQATAFNPLSGLGPLTRAASAIFGHAQVAMEVEPTPQHDLPKILHTTGAVTRKRYSETKAGAKAEFHHVIGAVVVEKEGRRFHLRSVIADQEGGFYDLDRYYHRDGSHKAERAEALVLGDTHSWFADKQCHAATFTRQDSLVRTLHPKRLVWHDVIDAYSVSHHHRRNAFTRLAKHRAGKASLKAELEDAARRVTESTPDNTVSVIVASNHHEHLRRWLEEADWRADPENAEIYLELALALARGTRMAEGGAETPDPFTWWCREYASKTTLLQFLARGESLRVSGVEVSFHGDVGVGGARGSRRSFDRVGTRSVIAHSHVPGITRGVYQCGTSSRLDLEYVKGQPSSWFHTHCVIYPNGKRQLVNVIEGRWRAK